MRCALLSVLLGLSAAPALALDVDFSGTVVSTCSLAISTPGVLGHGLDGASLTSELLAGGIPAVVSVLSIGTNTLDIGAPTLEASPVAYSTTGQALEVAYLGVGGLSIANQDFTTSDTQVIVGTLPLTLLTVNNRIRNDNGFPAGTYSTRTVITCGP